MALATALHGLVLADHSLMEDVLHPHQLGHLAFEQAAHGHARPFGHHLGDVFLVDLLLEHLVAGLELLEVLGRLVDAARKLGYLAVPDLGRLGQLAVALVALGLAAERLHLLFQVVYGRDGVFFALPVSLHAVGRLTQVGQLFVQLGQAFPGGVVGLLGQRDAFDLELADPPLDHVDLCR